MWSHKPPFQILPIDSPKCSLENVAEEEGDGDDDEDSDTVIMSINQTLFWCQAWTFNPEAVKRDRWQNQTMRLGQGEYFTQSAIAGRGGTGL